MYLSWMSSTTHTPIILPPKWIEENYREYLAEVDETANVDIWHIREHLPFGRWLNGLRWTDDIVKEIILGFRQRGLEDETLFFMYVLFGQLLTSVTGITEVHS
jgi:hypothetical protein